MTTTNAIGLTFQSPQTFLVKQSESFYFGKPNVTSKEGKTTHLKVMSTLKHLFGGNPNMAYDFANCLTHAMSQH
jgi:hypothetical protein